MIYILDAYNVIHGIPELESCLDRDLRSAREQLVAFCRDALSRRGDVEEIILVFDGRSEYRDLPGEGGAGLRVVFTETGEDADTRIVKILETLPQMRRVRVVSNDNFVSNHARAYGALEMRVAEFHALVTRRPVKPKKKGTERPDLPPGTRDRITEEYRKDLGLS